MLDVIIKCERCGGERSAVVLHMALCPDCDRIQINVGRSHEADIGFDPSNMPGPATDMDLLFNAPGMAFENTGVFVYGENRAEVAVDGVVVTDPKLAQLYLDKWAAEALLRRAYDELLVAQLERVCDHDGVTPSCVCEPGDPCPAHRTHWVLTEMYAALTAPEES